MASHHWLLPGGERSPPVGDVGQTLGFAVAPDGRSMAMALADTVLGTYDIWIHDFERRLSTRFTFDSETEAWPIWSPEGRWVAYGTNRLGRYAILRKSVTSGGAPDTVVVGRSSLIPMDWSPDGQSICYGSADSLGGWSLWSASVEGDQTPRRLRESRFDEIYGRYSPDGRWLAYGSSETGSYEIFVESVEPDGGRWRVSANSGGWPRWSPEGDRLYYITLGGQLMAAEVQGDGSALRLGRTETLAEDVPNSYLFNTFCVDPASGRLLVQRQASVAPKTDLTLVTGWKRELRSVDAAP
jgi:Tol biopolymer transport system component